MKKIMLMMMSSIFLEGCMSHMVTPVNPAILPPIADKTAQTVLHRPTKSEFMQSQPDDVKKSLADFERTGKTPIVETSQFIQFPFGRLTPKISCSPLIACDIALQPGEKITGVYPGDTLRWLFEEALSGEQQMHVIFKPQESDITTNAIITTSKRTYHLELISGNSATAQPITFY